MTRKFIDREEELELLEKLYSEPGPKLIIVYGRRRIGKTTLLKKSIEGKKALYFLCGKRKVEHNLLNFSKKVCEFLRIPEVNFESFIKAFEFLANKKEGIIILDEFGYLIEKDYGILSDFQLIIDEILKNTNIKLVLCGSSVSLMETEVLGYKSPLYGRADVQIKVKPLKFEYLFDWFGDLTIEDSVKLFGVTNNIPKYLQFFRATNIEKEIKENFFDDTSFLYNDAMNILKEELKDHTTYVQVLEAIALGHTKISEIGNYVMIPANEVYFYIRVLSRLGIVKRIVPLLSSKREKRGVYRIKDHYFNFWFRFVSPYQEDIESQVIEAAVKNFEKNFNTYLGRVFEDVVFDLIKRRKIRFKGLNFDKIGPYWDKNVEIDLLGLNESSKKLLAIECKWKDNIDPKKICKSLIDKLEYIDWNKEYRKEYLCIFAKSFKEKITEFDGYKVFCYDLKDIEKNIKQF